MIRALIVDDEAPARRRLVRLLEPHDDVEIAGEAADGVTALDQIDALAPDLVFLDIEMPGLGGLEVARTLASREDAAAPAVIFATAYDEHALAAFDAAALDYLVKPIAAPRLAQALDRVRRTAGEGGRLTALSARVAAQVASQLAAQGPDHAVTTRLAVRSGNRYIVCATAEISAIVAQDHYAQVICGERELLSEEALAALERRLDPERFLRVHRSALINLDFVVELRRLGDRKYVAHLGDAAGTQVPVSRDRLAELKARLGLDGS